MIYDKSHDSDAFNSSFDVSNLTILEKQIELQDLNLDNCLHEAQLTGEKKRSTSPDLGLPNYKDTMKSSLIGQCPNSNEEFQEEPISSPSVRGGTAHKAKSLWKLFYIAIALQVFMSCNFMIFNPHFSLQFRDDSPEARRLLSSISEGLKMISYLAKDLSVTLNDNNNVLSEINYIDTIDTFSDKHVYQFNAFQYCKHNTVDTTTKCIRTNGLDVFTSLVTDIGLQLGNVSKAEDPDKLAKSLVTTYSNLIGSLDETYYNKKTNNAFRLIQIDVATVKMAHSLKKSQNYGKMMYYITPIVVFVHPVICILLGLSCFTLSGTSKFATFNQRNSFCYSIIISVFVVFCFGITLFICSSGVWYFYRLNRILNNVNIARFNLGSGFIVLTLCYFLYCSLLYQIPQLLRYK